MIHNTLAFLLVNAPTLAMPALLASTLAALPLVDIMLDGDSSEPGKGGDQ